MLLIAVFQLSSYRRQEACDLTPLGTEVPISLDQSPQVSCIDTLIEVETKISKYEIYVPSNRIRCWQKIDTFRHNLTVHFPNGSVLKDIRFKKDQSTEGYSILENANIRIAFHSDGTMWVHVIAEGNQVDFISQVPRSYDRGGGLLKKGVDYFHQSELVLKTNWLIISDSQKNEIETTGGFGVYLRPLRGKDKDGNVAYFPAMERDRQNASMVHLLTNQPQYTGSSSFIISIFPAKQRDITMLTKRLQFIYPSLYHPAKNTRQYPYAFPDKDVLRCWTDTTWKPYRDDGGPGFHFWSPIDSTPLPVSSIIIFEDVWTRATEPHSEKPEYVKYRDPAFIPYVTPENLQGLHGTTEEELRQFLSLVSLPEFEHLDVLLYISACSDYFQIPHPLSEQEYYDMFMNQVKNLLQKYPRVNGFFIDTLPMNGDPETLEPMILSYRIMRGLKRLREDLFIILHNSENPIGIKRLHFDWNPRSLPGTRRNPARLVQLELYAPFIDRYADILLRGEGYPFNIALDAKGEVRSFVSKHLKYVVDPIGKSNSVGMLKWTFTGEPFAQPGSDYEMSYFDIIYPVSIGSSREADWYYFRYPQENENEEKINRLIIMNKIFDSFIKKGHLIIRGMAPQNLKGQYDRRSRYALSGPFESPPPHNYRNFFGPNEDYMRPVILGWYYSFVATR